jgi:acetyl-CoA C-acetyltransferase
MVRGYHGFAGAVRGMSERTVYIISARRSAIGRIGGLHARRRIADLAGPVAAAALADAGLNAGDVDEFVMGNMSEGGNPARIVALAAGLGETVPAMTVDRQCASGLEAIILARQLIQTGDAEVVLAGGADSASNAPWRIARPRSVHHQPRFLGLAGDGSGSETQGALHAPVFAEQGEALAEHAGIGRGQQDDWAWSSRERASRANEERRFSAEIVPLRKNAEEYRDQVAVMIEDAEELADLPAYNEPNGTVTAGTTAHIQDGSAFVVAVSEQVWQRLRCPPALEIVAHARGAVSTAQAGLAPLAAVEALLAKPALREAGLDIAGFERIEFSENTAAQGLAFSRAFDLDSGVLNACGGGVVRGHPLGASGAVVVVRLFADLMASEGLASKGLQLSPAALNAASGSAEAVKGPEAAQGRAIDDAAGAAGAVRGLAVSGALGGLGCAMAFNRVGGGTSGQASR